MALDLGPIKERRVRAMGLGMLSTASLLVGTDVPEMVAEIEQLRAEVTRLRTHTCWWWFACRGEGDHLPGAAIVAGVGS